MPCLSIPTKEDINRITKAFVFDLESFTVIDEVSKQIRPVICCICDSIPTKSQWSTFVHIDEFINLCGHAKLRKDDSVKLYSQELRNQYTAENQRLKNFILSPQTYVNTLDEVLLCKECLLELRSNYKKQTNRRKAPPESIIQGYMIGDAPDIL